MKFLITLLVILTAGSSFCQTNQNGLKFKVYQNGKIIEDQYRLEVLPVIDARQNQWIKQNDGYAYEQWKFRHFRRDKDWYIFDFENSGRFNRTPTGLMISLIYEGDTMYVVKPLGLDSISFRSGTFHYDRNKKIMDTISPMNYYYSPQPYRVMLFPAKTYYSAKKTNVAKLTSAALTYRGTKSDRLANTDIKFWHFERSNTVALHTDKSKRIITKIPSNGNTQQLALTTDAPDKFHIADLNFSAPLDTTQSIDWAKEPLLSLYVHSNIIFTKNWAIWHLTDLNEDGLKLKQGADKFYISVDDGLNWEKLPIKMESFISMNENNGVVLIEDGISFYCLHQNGLLVKSDYLKKGKQDPKILSSRFCFINESLGYLITRTNYETALLKTNDGGKSWTSILSGNGIYKMSASKELLIVELGTNEFYVSKNQGDDWSNLDLNEMALEREPLEKIDPLGGQITYAGKTIVGIQLPNNNYEMHKTYDSLTIDKRRSNSLISKDKSRILTYPYKYYSGVKKGRYYGNTKDTIYKPKLTFTDSTFDYKPFIIKKMKGKYAQNRYKNEVNSGTYEINDSIITFRGINKSSWFNGNFNYGFDGKSIKICHLINSGSHTLTRLDGETNLPDFKKLDLKLFHHQQRFSFTPEIFRIYITVTNGEQLIKDAKLTYGNNKVRFDEIKEQWYLDSRLVATYRPDYQFKKTSLTGVNLVIEHPNYAKKTIKFNSKGSHLYQLSSE